VASEPLGFGQGQAVHPDVLERLFHVVQLERLEDRYDQLHDGFSFCS
jgi:hypothetical protein